MSKEVTTESVNVEEETAALKSGADREKNLEAIFESDQNIRNREGSEILLKNGADSEELRAFYSRIDSIDNLNFHRVEVYLVKFGYPHIDSVSKNANLTPWLIIHHSTDVQSGKSKFKVLNEAYRCGNLNSNQFDLYLGRTYQFINGEIQRLKVLISLRKK